MRALSDAVIVGAGTVLADDPLLTVRDWPPPEEAAGWPEVQPVRVVVDSALRTPPGSRLVGSAEEAPVWIFAAGDAPTEREAITADFPKVSRVTYNRLAKPMRLGYDSTINYVLDRPEITTRESDRAKDNPYNTYANYGLPPTPISATKRSPTRSGNTAWPRCRC